jgi:hypothetical protein
MPRSKNKKDPADPADPKKLGVTGDKGKDDPKKTRKKGISYSDFLKAMSSHLKKEGISIPGRGGFLKKASPIWSNVKGTRGIGQDLDLVFEQYFKEQEAPTEIKKKSSDPDRLDKLGNFMDIDFSADGWWMLKDKYFALLRSGLFLEKDVLRLVDNDGQAIDFKGHVAEQLFTLVYRPMTIIINKEKKYTSSEVLIQYTGMKRFGDGGARLDVAIYGFSFDSIPKTTRFIEEMEPSSVPPPKQPQIEEIPEGGIREKTVPPEKVISKESELDRLIKIKQSLMEDVRFLKEMGEPYENEMKMYRDVQAKINKI